MGCGRKAATWVIATLILASCAPHRVPETPADAIRRDPEGFHAVEGLASWYGPGFHGRQTASGETYDSRDLTAAHRTLPFGTKLLVRNLANDRTVWVRVNDRGPFVDGRIIDLSYSAAAALGVVGPGTARVRLELGARPDLEPGTVAPVASAAVAPVVSEAIREESLVAPVDDAGLPWSVQVGAFALAQNAERLAQDLARRGIDARVAALGSLARVQVGGFPAEEDAARFAASLRRDGFEAIVVHAPEP